MSSNYPPGVTGNEPEIAGRPVRTMEVECDNDEMPVLGVHQMREMVRSLRTGLHSGYRIVHFEPLLEAIDDQQEVLRECYWNGTVEVEIEGNTAYWECPRCGQDNEHELDDGPDPDEQRDRMMEERWAE